MTPKELPLEGLALQHVDLTKDADYTPIGERNDDVTIDTANLITSRVVGKPDYHKVVLDIDIPAKLVPSSTPGHSHLYIDTEIDKHDYFALLEALENCGIIEPGYRGASLARGYTAARLPWIRKEVAE